MLIWEDLSAAQKRAIKEMSQLSFEKMIKIWFQLLQGQKFLGNWHFSYLCKTVEEIIDGKRQNVIFNITPGSGKTEIFSIHMPVYSMIRSKKIRNLNLSFSDSLVKDNGIRTREIIGSPEFQELWPCKLSKASGGDIEALNSEGKTWLSLTSRAIGGQVTGKRGGYMDASKKDHKFTGMLTLDDPDKPKDMLSPVKRKAAHMLLKNTVRSRRMHDKTEMAVVQQRLHINDSTWFLTNGGMGGIEFDVVSIPALVTEEYGDALPDWLKPEFERDVLSSDPVIVDGVKYYSFWPEKESAESLLALWKADEYTFLSQYQQAPIALGGNLFKSEWFVYYGTGDKATLPIPERFDYTFITADTAQKTNELNDFTAICYWGMKAGRAYFVDGVHGKFEAPELESTFKSFVSTCWSRNKELGNLRKIYIEDKASGTGLIQGCNKAFPIDITPVQRNNDKLTRAMDAMPVVKAGMVVLPEKHPLTEKIRSEMCGFTADDSHPNDDLCDNVFDAVNIEINLADNAVERMKKLAGMARR